MNIGRPIGRGVGRSLAGHAGIDPEPEPDPEPIIKNGSFDTDTDWTKGSGWSISGGAAVGVPAAAPADLAQVIVPTPGEYLFEFDLLNRTAGAVQARLQGGSGADVMGTNKSVNGPQTQTLVLVDHVTFAIRKTATFNGEVDNVRATYIGP